MSENITPPREQQEATMAANALGSPLREDQLDDAQREALDELVHELASRVASDVINNGKGLTYLLTNGMTIDEIRERIVQGDSSTVGKVNQGEQ